MNLKNRLIMSIIVVAIIMSIGIINAGLFDGSLGEETNDNVIEIENMAFNTTNVTKFKEFNKTEESGIYICSYIDENDTGYTIIVFNGSELDKSEFSELSAVFKEEFDTFPSETIDGVIVYTTSADSGDNVGQPRYVAYVQNKDLKTIVYISSPNPNETAKMVLSLKFR